MDNDEKLLRQLLWLNHGCTKDLTNIERKIMLRHGKFVQTEHGEIFVANILTEEKDG